MCVVDIKTYVYSDGREQDVETIHSRCGRATGLSGTCSRTETRYLGRVMEVRPPSGSSGEGFLVTEDRYGRQHTYRTVASSDRRRSGHRESMRHTGDVWSRPSSPASPVGAPTSSYWSARRPRPARPPQAAVDQDEYPPSLPPESGSARIVTPDWAKVDERPGRRDPERPRPVPLQPTTPVSGTSSRSHLPTKSSLKPRRPDISIATPTSPSNATSSSGVSSPGLSGMPTNIRDALSGVRFDSAVSIPQPGPAKDQGSRGSPSRESRPRPQDPARHTREQIEAEEQLQARLEQERFRERERLRKNRAAVDAAAAAEAEAKKLAAEVEKAARDASRERHLQAARDALEGRDKRARDELRQTEIERLAAECRRLRQESERLAASRLADEQMRRDAEARRRHERAGRPSSGCSSGYGASSPTSPRAPQRPVAPWPPQQPGHGYDPIHGRAQAVLARERVRAAASGLSPAESDLDSEGYEEEGERIYPAASASELQEYREARRARREAERARRRRQYFED